MTRLADQILTEALKNTVGWQEAERAQGLREQSIQYRPETARIS